MKINAFLPICLLMYCLMINIPSRALAQGSLRDSTIYRVETNGNDVFIGRLVSQNDTSLVLNVQKIGKITIPRSIIKNRTEIKPDRMKEGKYWF